MKAEYRRDPNDMWPLLFITTVTQGLPFADGPYIMLCYDQGYKEHDVDLELCMAISDDAVVDETRLPPPLRVCTLSTVPRAVSVSYVGSLGDLRLVCESLFRWIEQENLEIAGPYREIYVNNDLDPSHSKSYIMEIQQPAV